MNKDIIVYDKLNMLLAVGTIGKKAHEKAGDIYEWIKEEYPNSKISSMMISHIAVVLQHVYDNEQIEVADVEYKMPLEESELKARNKILSKVKSSVRTEIGEGEISYLDIHIRNFIYDNL